ncbi:unnamed protein product [Phyllotreta striolata]|uniref:Uncharacterized protein n=1 Tax=Phyllotreta striolata TaxID=444603 RepID=A0A9P0DW70_PHYSR|nr:unnamed protein product [Phyllotreta striolata]
MMYTMDDDELIINVIIENQAYYVLRGKTFWKDLAQEETFRDRTLEGLKTRFFRYIHPNIQKYHNISLLERRKIEVALHQTKQNFAYETEEGLSSDSSSDD